MKSIIPPKRIAYSVETLFHFICGECKGWWTISDDEGERVRELTCPRCKFSAVVHLPEIATEVSGDKLNPPTAEIKE